MTGANNAPVKFSVLGGIFFLSFAGLMFEVSLSRLLAITLWHHFAFLIISCALLGYGTAGSWQLIFRRKYTPFYPAALFSLTLVPLFYLSLIFPFDPALLPLNSFQWFNLILLFVIFSLPFFFIGLTINRLLSQFPGDSFRLYSFDLIGAACGCFGFFLIAPHFSEVEWLVIVSLIGTLGVCLLSENKRHYFVTFFIAAALITIWVSGNLPALNMSPYKSLPLALKYPGSKRIESRWNAVSRVDWFESPMARFAPGLSLNFKEELPEQIGITLDGGSLTAFSPWSSGNQSFLDYLPGKIVYDFLPTPSHILFLNVLGGQDVQLAIQNQVPEIQVQTENAILAEWLEEQKLPYNITIRAEKARTTLARSKNRFDRIIVSLEGALPTGSSGMSVLQKSSLETREGVTLLLNHLSSNGWLSFHRYLLPPPRAELRLAATLAEAMENLGWKPNEHMGIFRTISTIMFVVSVNEWTERDKTRFREFCSHQGHSMIFYPGMNLNEANTVNRFSHPFYADAIRRILFNRKDFLSEYTFDLRPVSDDNPFFYNFIRLAYLSEAYQIFGAKWEALVEVGLLIPGIFLIILLVAGFLIGLPFLFIKDRRSLLSKGMTYFFWIGLGFMGIEIVLFEKLTQFLGEPTYSLALVLGCLLVCSGIGSGLSQLLTAHQRNLSHFVLIIILAGYAIVLDPVLGVFTGSSFNIRICVAVLLTSTIGLLMGVPFPKGIVAMSKNQNKEAADFRTSGLMENKIALAWCLNGFASVIGSAGAMLWAQYLGLSSLFVVASVLYAMAYYTFRKI